MERGLGVTELRFIYMALQCCIFIIPFILFLAMHYGQCHTVFTNRPKGNSPGNTSG